MVAGLVVTALAYAIGSISFGYLLVRWRTGLDLRTLGSGSAGGRNVARQLGRAWGIASGTLDALKGSIATALALIVAPAWLAPAMAAVVAGHAWPAPLRFRGGRGIAPAFGAIAVADPLTAAVALGTFAAVAAVARRTMPGFAAGVLVAPVVPIVAGRPAEVVVGVAASIAIVLVAHAPLLRAGGPRPIGLER